MYCEAISNEAMDINIILIKVQYTIIKAISQVENSAQGTC